MKADDFLQENPTFDIQDLDFLKADGKHDQNMLSIWNKQLRSNEFAGMRLNVRPLDLKAI